MREEWKSMRLGEFLTLQRGFDLPSRLRQSGLYPIVTSSGIESDHIEPKVKGPGVVTGRYGTIGKVFYVPQDFWPLNTTLYVRDFRKNNRLFSAYLLRTVDFQEHSGKSGVPGVNRNDLHEISIFVPSTNAEQEAIAGALSDADALIESLEQLLVKKRLIKQGAMQELLTGKRRLSGFNNEWSSRILGDMASIDPENLNSDTRLDYSFKYISLEDVDVGILRSYTEQLFSTAPSRARRKLRRNDILVSTVRPNLKSHLFFDNHENDWVCSTGFSVVRCKAGEANPKYVYFHLFSDEVSRQIETLLTGSNYPAINGRDVHNLQIPFPEYQEQTAIAEILSDMDADIAALEEKLVKACQIKQGMMAELLTGRIRLV